MKSFNHLPYNQEFFQDFTDALLTNFYPRKCRNCSCVMDGSISTRPYVMRCRRCHYQASRLKGTPLENLRLPRWYFGWCVYHAIQLFPQVLTAACIQRSLMISGKSAALLKRRMQIWATESMTAVKTIVHKDLKARFGSDFRLPADGEDLTKITARRHAVSMDSMALFSASQRANKGRKNWKNRGLTASIYLQDRLGGRQIGTLVHVIATQGGWCVLDSVRDQKAATLGPLIDAVLPRSTMVFTDEGYPWLKRIFPNHRMVNHSARSPDSRWRFARNRWCKNGVHNQVAEGINSSVKHAMRTYRYFRPKYSKLYLSEWAFLKNIKHFGMQRVAQLAKRNWWFNHRSSAENLVSQNHKHGSKNTCVDSSKVIKLRALLHRHAPQQSHLHLQACG